MRPTHGIFIKDIGPENRELHLVQNESLEMLLHFDVQTIINVFLNYVVFFIVVLALSFWYV